MSGYFEQADPRRVLAEYPVGDEFLATTAKLSEGELRRLQNERFRKVVARAWEVPFYARRWGAAGLVPGDIRSLDDIEAIPPFSKHDLMRSVEEHPPFGDYHGRGPQTSPDRPSTVFHTTSGTTGAPQPLFFGAWDREVQNALLMRAYRLQGLRDDDVVHSVYGFGMVNGGHYVREAVLHFSNALLLPAGTGLETPSAQQVELMRRFGATVLVGFADYLKRLGEVARDRGLRPADDLGIRLISGHVGEEDPALLSALWGGAGVFDWYGVGDTGTIAAQGPGSTGLYLWEDAHFVELLDPSHAVVAGGAGTVCATVLFKHTVYPVIRFNTNDVTELLPVDPHAAVRFRRMVGFRGRADSMVKLRGINVYPSAVGALLAVHEALTGEFVCTVRRDGARDEMTVHAEVRDAVAPDEALARSLGARLREHLGVGVRVRLTGAGGTAELTQIDRRQKPVRLIDERTGPLCR